jgi:hypothetical protein
VADLKLPNPSGLPPAIDAAFDEVIAPLQTWAGKVDGFGRWIDVPYSQEFFSASAGTWTVDAGDWRHFSYTVIGDVMLLRAHLQDTTTASVTNQLFLRLPPGFQCRDNWFIGTFAWWDATGAGTYGVGTALGTRAGNDSTRLNLVRDVLPTSTNWPSVTNLLSFGFDLRIPVVRL